MTGVYLMPAHMTPRSLRGDAKIDLDGQRMELRELLQELHSGKARAIEAIEEMFLRASRRTANAYRMSNQIDESLRAADEAEQAFAEKKLAVV
jgi:hypothetical protein